MSLRVLCPGCQSALALPDDLCGKKVKCKKSACVFQVGVGAADLVKTADRAAIQAAPTRRETAAQGGAAACVGGGPTRESERIGKVRADRTGPWGGRAACPVFLAAWIRQSLFRPQRPPDLIHLGQTPQRTTGSRTCFVRKVCVRGKVVTCSVGAAGRAGPTGVACRRGRRKRRIGDPPKRRGAEWSTQARAIRGASRRPSPARRPVSRRGAPPKRPRSESRR